MPDEPIDGMTDRIAGLIQDCMALAGAAMITGGVTMIFEPAGFIAAGSFLLGAAWLSARRTTD